MHWDRNICISAFRSFLMSEIDSKFKYTSVDIKFVLINCLSIKFSSPKTETLKNSLGRSTFYKTILIRIGFVN